MSAVQLKMLKVLVFAACLAPAVWLGWRLYQSLRGGDQLGPDPTATVTFFTGRATLRLLVISLAITPVRRLSTRLAWLIRFRRMLGLFAFFYGCLHLLTYVALYANFDLHAMKADILHRRFILAGLVAWGLMVPLALTSTKWAIRKLGGKRWQALHRIVYVSAVAAVVHYWWKVKPGDRTPLQITIILAILLLARLVYTWRSKFPSTPPPQKVPLTGAA
ncbi:MAG TPA: protein-methionine-sulfoxide reductase heme-binding subunit MsrQ [Acidisarcina sp.]